MSEFISGIFNRHKNEQPKEGEGESSAASIPAFGENPTTTEVSAGTDAYVAELGTEAIVEPVAEAPAMDPLSDPEHIVTDAEETPAAAVAELAVEDSAVGSDLLGDVATTEAVATDEAEGAVAEEITSDDGVTDDGEGASSEDASAEEIQVEAANVFTVSGAGEVIETEAGAEGEADTEGADAVEVGEDASAEENETVDEPASEGEVLAEGDIEEAPTETAEAFVAADTGEAVETESVETATDVSDTVDDEVPVGDASIEQAADQRTDVETTEAVEESFTDVEAPGVEQIADEARAQVAEEAPVDEATDTVGAVSEETIEKPATVEEMSDTPAPGFAPDPVVEPESTADSTVTGVLRAARESRGKSTVSEGLVERLVHHIAANVDGVHAIDEEGTVVDIVDEVANITVSYVIAYGTSVKGNAVSIRTQVIEAVEDYFDIDVAAVDVNVSDFYIA